MIQVIKEMSEIKDINQLTSLIKKQLPSHSHHDSRKILRSLENALSTKSSAVLFLCQSDQDTYQGFVFANIASGLESGGDYLWINELFIDEHYRHQRLGSQLIEFIEDWCKENELKYMLCITSQDNLNAKAFYRNQGFDLSEVTWVSKEVLDKK
jgi:GNAT superfamily N-acetyltransferase